jgi:hypothetical protein
MLRKPKLVAAVIGPKVAPQPVSKQVETPTPTIVKQEPVSDGNAPVKRKPGRPKKTDDAISKRKGIPYKPIANDEISQRFLSAQIKANDGISSEIPKCVVKARGRPKKEVADTVKRPVGRPVGTLRPRVKSPPKRKNNYPTKFLDYLKSQGYMIKGGTFKKMPKKDTPEYLELIKGYHACKETAGSSCSSA